jgi:hypothetical protein
MSSEHEAARRRDSRARARKHGGRALGRPRPSLGTPLTYLSFVAGAGFDLPVASVAASQYAAISVVGGIMI